MWCLYDYQDIFQIAISAFGTEEFGYEPGAFFGEDPGIDLGPGVEQGRGEEGEAALGVRTAIDHPAYLGPA